MELAAAFAKFVDAVDTETPEISIDLTGDDYLLGESVVKTKTSTSYSGKQEHL